MSKAHIIAAVVVGFVVGFFVPFLGIIVALVVGVVMYHVINPDKKMAPKPGKEQQFVFKLMFVIGLILVMLVLFLPVSDEGLYISDYRNPPTYMNYLSILILEPDSIANSDIQVRSPGLPILVVPAVLMVAIGGMLPGGLLQKRMKMALIMTGLVILTMAPVISHFALDANGDILYDYNFMFWLGWAGMALMLASEFLPDKMTPQGAYAILFIFPAVATLAQIIPNLGALQLDFESAHHSLAGLFGGLMGGLAGANGAEELEPESFTLELTHPAGRSPKVFTEGWLFGAKCIVDQGGPKEKDLSDSVEWSGTGSFNPSVGSTSRPIFGSPGKNKIKLTVRDGAKTKRRTFTVTAITPHGYASMMNKAYCNSDAHGCPACPHPVVCGAWATSSPTVLINNAPALRVGDLGIHAACCGPNQCEIITGSSQVLIDGRPAARAASHPEGPSQTKHCGGFGKFDTW